MLEGFPMEDEDELDIMGGLAAAREVWMADNWGGETAAPRQPPVPNPGATPTAPPDDDRTVADVMDQLGFWESPGMKGLTAVSSGIGNFLKGGVEGGADLVKALGGYAGLQSAYAETDATSPSKSGDIQGIPQIRSGWTPEVSLSQQLAEATQAANASGEQVRQRESAAQSRTASDKLRELAKISKGQAFTADESGIRAEGGMTGAGSFSRSEAPVADQSAVKKLIGAGLPAGVAERIIQAQNKETASRNTALNAEDYLREVARAAATRDDPKMAEAMLRTLSGRGNVAQQDLTRNTGLDQNLVEQEAKRPNDDQGLGELLKGAMTAVASGRADKNAILAIVKTQLSTMRMSPERQDAILASLSEGLIKKKK